MRRISLLMLVVLVGITSLVGAQSHPFSVLDMQALDRVSDPQVAPDGRSILFVIRKTYVEADRGRTDVYLIGVDGSNLRQLTTDPAGDFNGR
ncbi:MAG: S9 family peptidase, partial [Planctomycetes bacterium]|nr:S9 family peptidase [Planctomycetota bacterium]